MRIHSKMGDSGYSAFENDASPPPGRPVPPPPPSLVRNSGQQNNRRTGARGLMRPFVDADELRHPSSSSSSSSGSLFQESKRAASLGVGARVRAVSHSVGESARSAARFDREQTRRRRRSFGSISRDGAILVEPMSSTSRAQAASTVSSLPSSSLLYGEPGPTPAPNFFFQQGDIQEGRSSDRFRSTQDVSRSQASLRHDLQGRLMSLRRPSAHSHVRTNNSSLSSNSENQHLRQDDEGFCVNSPCCNLANALARFPCSLRYIGLMVRRPCLSLIACLFLPLLLSALSLADLKLEFDVGLSSFAVDHSHPISMNFDALWNAKRTWSDARKEATAKREQKEKQHKQNGGTGGRLLSTLYEVPAQTHERSVYSSTKPTADIGEDWLGMRRSLASTISTKFLHDRIELVFYSTVEGGNVITEESFDAMRQIEAIVESIPMYDAFCWKFKSGDCVPPNSLTTYFFPSRSADGALRFDGAGEKTPYFDFTLAEILNQPSTYFFFSDDVDPKNKSATFTKTVFVLSLDLDGKWASAASAAGKTGEFTREEAKEEHKVFLRNIAKSLDQWNAEADRGEHPVRVVYGGESMTVMQVLDALWSDVTLAALSLIVVFALTLNHIRSLFLTVAGLGQICLTFPVVFYLYAAIMGKLKLGILNVLSVYLILGIGVDDLFVLMDAFKQEGVDGGASSGAMSSSAALRSGRVRMSLQTRLASAYSRGAAAMLLTSFTTSMSFICNVGTRIPVIQSFMVFMTLLVASNYALVITVFPALIVIHAKYIQEREYSCQAKLCSCLRSRRISIISHSTSFHSSNVVELPAGTAEVEGAVEMVSLPSKNDLLTDKGGSDGHHKKTLADVSLPDAAYFTRTGSSNAVQRLSQRLKETIHETEQNSKSDCNEAKFAGLSAGARKDNTIGGISEDAFHQQRRRVAHSPASPPPPTQRCLRQCMVKCILQSKTSAKTWFVAFFILVLVGIIFCFQLRPATGIPLLFPESHNIQQFLKSVTQFGGSGRTCDTCSGFFQNEAVCSGIDCGRNGECELGVCRCKEGWRGRVCQYKVCDVAAERRAVNDGIGKRQCLPLPPVNASESGGAVCVNNICVSCSEGKRAEQNSCVDILFPESLSPSSSALTTSPSAQLEGPSPLPSSPSSAYTSPSSLPSSASSLSPSSSSSSSSPSSSSSVSPGSSDDRFNPSPSSVSYFSPSSSQGGPIAPISLSPSSHTSDGRDTTSPSSFSSPSAAGSSGSTDLIPSPTNSPSQSPSSSSSTSSTEPSSDADAGDPTTPSASSSGSSATPSTGTDSGDPTTPSASSSGSSATPSSGTDAGDATTAPSSSSSSSSSPSPPSSGSSATPSSGTDAGDATTSPSSSSSSLPSPQSPSSSPSSSPSLSPSPSPSPSQSQSPPSSPSPSSYFPLAPSPDAGYGTTPSSSSIADSSGSIDPTHSPSSSSSSSSSPDSSTSEAPDSPSPSSSQSSFPQSSSPSSQGSSQDPPSKSPTPVHNEPPAASICESISCGQFGRCDANDGCICDDLFAGEFCDQCAVPGHVFPKCDTPMPPAVVPTNKNYAVVSVVFGIKSMKHSVAAVESLSRSPDKAGSSSEQKESQSSSSSSTSLGRLDDTEQSRMGVVIYDDNFDLSNEDCQVSSNNFPFSLPHKTMLFLYVLTE